MKLRMLLLTAAVFAIGCSSSQVEITTKSAEGAVLGDAALVAQITTRLIGVDEESAFASHDGSVTLSGRAKSASVAERFAAAAKASQV